MWKRIPYWLRGGIIGVGVMLASFFLTNVCEILFVSPNESLGLEFFAFAIPFIPFWFFPKLTFVPIAVYYIIVTLSWFIVGAIVGTFSGHKKRVRFSELFEKN